MPIKLNSSNKLDQAENYARAPSSLDRRHTSPFLKSEYVNRTALCRWNSSPYPVTEARFHRSEDASLESGHVLEYLRQSTSRIHDDSSGLVPLAGSQRAVLEALSCEETICDESIKSIQEILKKNSESIFIKALRLPRNQLSSAAAEPLAKILEITETLLHLDIRHNRVGSDGLAKLLQPLTERGCSLVTLNLVDNNLKRKAASFLSDLLRKNTSLREVHLGLNPLKSGGVKELLVGLQANEESEVHHLDLKGTALGGKGAGLKALIDLLKRNETIKSLDLSYNSFGAHGAREFSSVFMFKNALHTLELRGNEIGPTGVSAIANALNEDRKVQGHCHLQRLTLDFNQIGNAGAAYLAVCLERNSTLQYLDVSHNGIGALGALKFAKSFGVNYCLKEVLLNDNTMDDEGAFALANVLGTKKCSVEKISWGNNPDISDHGYFFLNHVFKFRESLKTWLGELQEDIKADRRMCVNWWTIEQIITDWEVGTLAQSVIEHKPQKLQSIWLTGQRITDQSLGVLLSNYLADNPPLERLYLKSVSIDEGVPSLQKALCTNSTLRVLSVTRCGLSAADAASLAVALKHNATLERLSLQGNEIGDEGFRFLWQVINPKGMTPHQSLVFFNLGKNKLSDVAMATLREAGTVGALKELHLDRNLITDRGALDLARGIMDSATLKALSVAHNNHMSYRGKNALRMFAPDRFAC